MTDPIEGHLGSLVMSGWIAEAPTGRDEAFLLLTTPDSRAGHTMPAVAAALGMQIGGVAGTLEDVTAQITDGWVTLTVGGDRMERPVTADWTQVARTAGQVVLVIGAAPMPPGMDADEYTQRHESECGIGLVLLKG